MSGEQNACSAVCNDRLEHIIKTNSLLTDGVQQLTTQVQELNERVNQLSKSEVVHAKQGHDNMVGNMSRYTLPIIKDGFDNYYNL